MKKIGCGFVMALLFTAFSAYASTPDAKTKCEKGDATEIAQNYRSDAKWKSSSDVSEYGSEGYRYTFVVPSTGETLLVDCLPDNNGMDNGHSFECNCSLD